jgi:hypothetical protein
VNRLKNEKLNTLVLTYKNEGNEDVFNEIYHELIEKRDHQFEKIGKSIRSNYHETRALYEDVLLRCIERYDGSTDFRNFYNAAVALERKGFYGKNKRIFEREVYYEAATESTDEPNAATFEFADDYNLEDDVLKTTEADQRQLIGFLTAKGDATTTAIVEAFLASERPTPTAIGKQLGLHHSTVTRKLRRLARHFGGDYRDYLRAYA